ncbi:uncharacterized protein LOC118438424 [Folsomia candida]|uniref:uncharacterized protein LOC118438424 n=1 Tax=Folsomia candida TaxID=158441 RepID=UPI001604E082|nr:uncharacterized protein LOC118438424 [Folsomia candida]
MYDLLSCRLEMHNLFSQNKPSSSRLGATNDFYFQNQSIPPTGFRERRLRDFREIGRAQAVFEQHNAINLNQTALQSPWHKSYTKAHFVRKFVKSIVKHRLQALGVQQLDCNEIIDKWEAKQSNPFSFLFPKDDDLNEGEWNHAGMISPLISKPNSDLFHLSPSGHITKSIFSTFVNQVETLKGILNNATCNLVHTQVCLLLPEIKLLWGRQLDTNRNPVFILEWMRLIILAGVELDPTSPEQVLVMINRELKTLRNLSNQLYKSSKKVFHKIESLSKFSEEIFRKTLAQLNPKSLKKLDAFNNAMRKKYSPDVIHFDPDQLHKIRIAPADLFQDHLFLSETHKGELLVKNDIDGFWGKYLDLEFADRRTIFLGMTDDLQTTLRACLHTVQHLQEIYTTGYPGSIKNLLKDVVQELKFTSKRDDLTLLIKTSIVTHVSCLHEMLTRLLCISKEVKGVTKQFTECLQPASFDLKKLKRQFKKRDKKSCEVSDTDTTTFSGFYHYNNFAAGSGNSNAQLVIPFSSLSVDLAFKSHTLNDSV